MRSVWKRFLAMFRGRRLDEELDSEMGLHLEMLEEQHRARGLSPEEARSAARRDFGGLAQAQEAYRARRGLSFLETLWQDVRCGARTLRRSPGLTAAVVLTLMLGIGANTAVFSVIYSVLLKPFPYKDPGRLVWIAEYVQRFHAEIVTGPDFLDWRRLSHSFDAMAAFFAADQTLTGDGDAVEVRSVFTSESLRRILGVAPALGRDFLPEELQPGPGEPRRVALLSDRLFRQRFGGDRSVLGKNLALSTGPHTIIGVLPPDFRLALPSPLGPQTEADVVVNFPLNPAGQRRGGPMIIVQVMGRLKPGVPIAAARAELETIRAALASQYPGGPPRELRLIPLYDRIVGGNRRALFVLWAAVGFVLLVACVNVANLLLARATARERETAIRAALGAGRLRLIRQLLTESLVLAFAGGAAGLLLAWWGIRALVYASPIDIPRLQDAALNANVLIFSLGLCTLVGILSGLAPAWAGSRARLSDTLKSSGNALSASGRRRGLHDLLVVAELALALVLLAGAGLMLKSLWVMRSEMAQYQPEHVLTCRIEVLNPRLARPMEKTHFVDGLVRRIESMPGVRAAAAFTGRQKGVVRIAGAPEPAGGEVTAEFPRVTPHYFASAGVRLLAGRAFGDQDQENAPRTAVVNEALARRFFPAFPRGGSPVGRQIIIPAPPGQPPTTIVGVVGDFRSQPDADPMPQVFLPHWQNPFQVSSDLLVRASSDPMALADVIRGIAGRTPRVNVIGPRTLEEQLSAAIAPRRFQAVLLATFAVVALLLAMVGAYGVLSYAVTERTHEVGVRRALGALDRDVLRMVLAHGVRLVGAGTAAGLAASLALTRLMRSLLYGVTPADAWTLASVSLLLMVVALLAAYIPARRAVRVDPMAALRYE